jgi:hypothetical protein
MDDAQMAARTERRAASAAAQQLTRPFQQAFSRPFSHLQRRHVSGKVC